MTQCLGLQTAASKGRQHGNEAGTVGTGGADNDGLTASAAGPPLGETVPHSMRGK